jgi:hypothetical protein
MWAAYCLDMKLVQRQLKLVLSQVALKKHNLQDVQEGSAKGRGISRFPAEGKRFIAFPMKEGKGASFTNLIS